MTLPSKELLEAVLDLKFMPAVGLELREKSFGYDPHFNTLIQCKCDKPLHDDEWICIRNNTITFGFKDIRPEVLKNIPDGVFTDRSINIYELMHLCEEWAWEKGYTFNFARYCIDNYQFTISIFYEEQSLDGIGDVPVFRDKPEAVFAACQWILEHLDGK